MFGNIFSKVKKAEELMKQKKEQYDTARDVSSRSA